MHPRTLIRYAVAALLVAAATAAGTRVYRTRKVPHRTAELPVINVYTLEESTRDESQRTSPRELERDISLVLECWVTASDEKIDDAMDDIAKQVEDAMHADFYLPDPQGEETAADSMLQSTTLEVLEQGDRLLGMAALVYSVTRRDIVPAAPTLDDFLRFRAVYNLGNEVHPNEVAEDTVTVQEVA